MKASFRLVRPKSENYTALYLDINHQQVRKRWGTGISIHPQLWNQEKQRAIPSRYFFRKHQKDNPGLQTKLDNINAEIEAVLRSIEGYIRKSQVNGHLISSVGLKEYLNENLKSKTQSDNKPTKFLTAYMEEDYIPRLESGEITYTHKNRRKRYASSTIKSKKQALNAFKDFQEENGMIRFDDVDQSFYNQFVNWNEDQNFSTNYIGKLIKELKVILKQAYADGIHSNKFFEDDNFAALREDTHAVYLTKEELRKLYELDLEGDDEHYLSVFLVGCETALRFSDYSRLNKDHIVEEDGQKFIDIITKKTGERVLIPINPDLLAILSNDNFLDQSPVHEQKLNKAIKLICKKAGITTLVQMEKTKGGKTVSIKKPKYKLVTSHTARRTGASLMYLANIPPIDIMKITGHKSQDSFLKYIRVTKKETASRLALHPYFNRKLKKA